MKKSRLIPVLALASVCLFSAGAAYAQATPLTGNASVQQIAQQLSAQGYVIVSVGKTLLGRIKIDAIANGYKREIIISATNGKVMHDEWSEYTGLSIEGLDLDHNGFADDLEGHEVQEFSDGESDSESGSDEESGDGND